MLYFSAESPESFRVKTWENCAQAIILPDITCAIDFKISKEQQQFFKIGDCHSVVHSEKRMGYGMVQPFLSHVVHQIIHVFA